MDYLLAIRGSIVTAVLALAIPFFLSKLGIIPPLRQLGQTIFSRVIHQFLLLQQPIRHTGSGAPIPTALYQWPNGQGDAAKFLHGKDNSRIWRETHGKIYRIWSGTTSEIVLTTPEQIKAVFADSDQHRKAINNDSGYLLGQLLGKCVGLISREDWKRVHAVTEMFFHREASNRYVPLVARQVNHRLDLYERSASFAAGLIDPAKDLKMIPFWIVAEILYGPLDQAMEEELLSLVPIREQLFLIALGGGVARFTWSKYLPTDTNKQLTLFKSRWHTFNTQARTTAAKRGAPRAPIVLYFEAVDGGVCSESEILQTIDEMLFANLDVTLGGMTWTLVQLAANEKEQTTLRDEVIDAYQAAADEIPSAYLTSSSTYLQGVISESSRLRPLAAFSVPQSAPTARILEGYKIPAGTNFIIDSHSLNERNPFWGEDAASFRPERFLEGKRTEARYNLWRFGFGPRQCQGNLKLTDATGKWKRDPEVWISHPDMRLGCSFRASPTPSDTGIMESSKPVWKPGEEISGFQLSEAEVTERLSGPGRNLLLKYAGVPADKIIQHVVAIQQQAYATCPPGYKPFIGYIRFLAFPLLEHPSYNDVLALMTPRGEASPKTLLDVGCCFGQDMRQLALDGANLSKSLGVDIEGSFLKLGHQLFCDDGEQMRFDVADIFSPEDVVWKRLDGQVDVAHVSNFFHGFDLARQRVAANQIGRLLRGDEAGRFIVGCCVGSTEPREVAIVSKENTSFCHDAASFARLWDEIGSELEMRFSVEATLNALESHMQVGPLAEASMRMMVFKVSVL